MIINFIGQLNNIILINVRGRLNRMQVKNRIEYNIKLSVGLDLNRTKFIEKLKMFQIVNRDFFFKRLDWEGNKKV